ncbi:MAG: hypothetical protein ACRERC_17195 [Candidatus Binatia bacterium]
MMQTASRAQDITRVPGFAEEYLPHVILHPVQFQEIWSGEPHRPEKELAAAVIENAASDLRNFRYARKRRRQRLYWQAYQWVASDSREWPYSFINLCEFLRVSPAALRQRMLADEEPRQVQQAA